MELALEHGMVRSMVLMELGSVLVMGLGSVMGLRSCMGLGTRMGSRLASRTWTFVGK